MTALDVESTLQALKMQVYHKGEHKIVLPTHLIQKHEKLREKQKTKPKRLIDPNRISWKPPVFTASTRTWGWQKHVKPSEFRVKRPWWGLAKDCIKTVY